MYTGPLLEMIESAVSPVSGANQLSGSFVAVFACKWSADEEGVAMFLVLKANKTRWVHPNRRVIVPKQILKTCIHHSKHLWDFT